MSKQPVIKRASSLFSLSDQMAAAEDVIKLRLSKYGDGIHVEIALSDIDVSDQVRQQFDAESVDQLAKSIQQNGLLYPIIVTKSQSEPNRYMLLVGENRYRAFKQLNFKTIPAIVKDNIEKTSDRIIIQLIENMHRRALNAIEVADAMMAIRSEDNLTLAQLAEKIGRSLDTCKKYSRIHKLSDAQKAYHLEKQSSFKHIMKGIDGSKSTAAPISVQNKQMSLFKQTKNKCELRKLTLDIRSEDQLTLTSKIEACEAFLSRARRALRELPSVDFVDK